MSFILSYCRYIVSIDSLNHVSDIQGEYVCVLKVGKAEGLHHNLSWSLHHPPPGPGCATGGEEYCVDNVDTMCNGAPSPQ